MTEESEEACLVQSTTVSNYPSGAMPYTDGVQSFSHYGGQVNNTFGAPGPFSTSGRSQRYDGGRSDSGRPTGRGYPQTSQESESGDLMDYNDDLMMCQFHADAIKQAGFGKFQYLAAIILGLGLAGHGVQIYSVFYILPSAELEYCIKDSEKSWLSSITLLGMGCGSLLWGGLAGRTGRRKTLLSCLAVSAVFSVVAAFMPTYGPFMMARFCAAAGVGGALPAGASYLCEITPSFARVRIMALFGCVAIIETIFNGQVAQSEIPHTGQLVMLDSKEHFSAWHRYLLLITVSTFASILGIFWLPESPRWLLQAGREVEALSIYQKIYRTNRIRGDYTLTELELPAARMHRNTVPTTVLAGMADGTKKFFASFFQLFSKAHARTSLLLLASWTATLFVCHGLTIFISEHAKYVEEQAYNDQSTNEFNRTYENMEFVHSLDNIFFIRSKFNNCTFRRLFINHVNFINCTFTDTEFSNVKISKSHFTSSAFTNVKFIDTGIAERHFTDCVQNNTEIISMTAGCDQDFDYNIYFHALWTSNLAGIFMGFVGVLCVGVFIARFGRSRIATVCFTFATMLSCAIGFLFISDHVIWVGGTVQGLILAGLVALTLLSVENYTTPLRCSALGLFVCGGHIGALVSSSVYTSLPVSAPNFASALSTLTMVVPVLSAAALKDPCLLL